MNEKILIMDIDSTIPNLALHKIAKYHTEKKDEVIWNFPLAKKNVDKIYISIIFDWNKKIGYEYEDAIIGGSGWDICNKLPAEIENIKPHINLGFTTRGCPRKCKFCVVPDKEGKEYIVGDLFDLWDGKNREITILDNNILSIPQHFELICKQAIQKKIKIDFNQGLDYRFLTPEIVNLLKITPHKEYKFAFDHPTYVNGVEKTINILKKGGINRCTWYVLCGYDTEFNEDLQRLNYLRKNGQNAFVQRYSLVYKNKKYIALARWANQHHIFQAMTWEEFLNHKENKTYKKLFTT